MNPPVKPQRLSLSSALSHWESLPDNQPIKLTPIDTKHTGSTYDQDSIRITGSKEFIDTCMSNLKGLLDWNNDTSRLEILYTETTTRFKDEETGKLVTGELTGSYALYVKAKSRGQGRGKRGPSRVHEDGYIPPARKPREQPETPPAQPAKGSPKPKPGEPVYGIVSDINEEEKGADKYTWAEPDGTGHYPCDTYETFPDADVAIERLKKDKRYAKQSLSVVEMEFDKKGRLIFREV
jgi:hypothetical protein